MPRARDPNRDEAFELFRKNGGNIQNREIARQLGISEKTVSGWKCKDKWNEKLNGVLQTKKRSTPKRKRGGQPGNHNATGPPEKNKNAQKHGLFAKYLPEETMDIVENMTTNPLDILWDNIRIAYAAIVRAQQIMYVKDQEDATVEHTGTSEGGDTYNFQQAWDKQANFMQAQARAQAELRSLIKQYDEMLHKDWELATEEQKIRIEHLKAQTERDKAQTKQEEEATKMEVTFYMPDNGREQDGRK